jgi:hypothetical protein
MADIAQVLATYDALAGVAVGAGLTYGFGALNRRHQEAREDRTRWYDARLKAYIEFYQAAYDAYFTAVGSEQSGEVSTSLVHRLMNAIGAIHFVGSPEVTEAAVKVFDAAFEELGPDREMSGDFLDHLEHFQVVARKDLGHP